MKVEPIVLLDGNIPAIIIHNDDYSYELIVDNTGTIHNDYPHFVHYKYIEGPIIKF